MVGEALDLQVLSCSQEAFQSVLVHLNLGITGLNNDLVSLAEGFSLIKSRHRGTKIRNISRQLNTGITGPIYNTGSSTGIEASRVKEIHVYLYLEFVFL